jgi:HD superfamily phosphohydrolase
MLSNFCLNHADNHVDHCFASVFQIICNRENGIDVDRWDYFLRDGHQLNISISFDYTRILEFCRVINFSGEDIICFRSKERHSLYDMFKVRAHLFHRAYFHDVVRNIEEM